jgi:hypothetical protein
VYMPGWPKWLEYWATNQEVSGSILAPSIFFKICYRPHKGFTTVLVFQKPYKLLTLNNFESRKFVKNHINEILKLKLQINISWTCVTHKLTKRHKFKNFIENFHF